MKVFIKQEHIFYKIETGKVTAVNTIRQSVKILVCVPSIYANKLEVITESDYENAKTSLGI